MGRSRQERTPDGQAKPKTLAAAKAKKQKIILIVGGVLLLAVAAFQGPKLMKGSGSTADAPTPAPPSARPAHALTPVAGGGRHRPDKGSAIVAGVALPRATVVKVAPSQLASFTLFEVKDPFVPQVGDDGRRRPSASRAGAPPAGTAPARRATGYVGGSTAGSPPAVRRRPHRPPPIAYATINFDGKPQQVQVEGQFPTPEPLFVLRSLKKKQAKIGVAGGSFDDGQPVTLKLGKKVTLVNTATGVRYVLKLVYTGCAARGDPELHDDACRPRRRSSDDNDPVINRVRIGDSLDAAVRLQRDQRPGQRALAARSTPPTCPRRGTSCSTAACSPSGSPRSRPAPARKKKSGGMFEKKVQPKSLQVFSRQFATMIEAGLSVVTALVILEEQTDDVALGGRIDDVREQVETGALLSEAMARHPDVFSRLYIAMVEAGEAAGVLDTVLDRVAIQIEKEQKIKRRVKGAMIYPTVVLVVRDARDDGHADVPRPDLRQHLRSARRRAADADAVRDARVERAAQPADPGPPDPRRRLLRRRSRSAGSSGSAAGRRPSAAARSGTSSSCGSRCRSAASSARSRWPAGRGRSRR